jgi:hypothetical protein
MGAPSFAFSAKGGRHEAFTPGLRITATITRKNGKSSAAVSHPSQKTRRMGHPLCRGFFRVSDQTYASARSARHDIRTSHGPLRPGALKRSRCRPPSPECDRDRQPAPGEREVGEGYWRRLRCLLLPGWHSIVPTPQYFLCGAQAPDRETRERSARPGLRLLRSYPL